MKFPANNILVFLLLSACQTPEEIADRQAQIEADKIQYCVTMGAPPKSANYYHCRQSIEQRVFEETQQQKTAEIARQAHYQQQMQIRQDAQADLYSNIFGTQNTPTVLIQQNAPVAVSPKSTHCVTKTYSTPFDKGEIYTDCD